MCIFKVGSTLLAGISIVYLNFGFLRAEYTLRVCIILWSYFPTQRYVFFGILQNYFCNFLGVKFVYVVFFLLLCEKLYYYVNEFNCG